MNQRGNDRLAEPSGNGLAPLSGAPMPSQTLGLGQLECTTDVRVLVIDDDPAICHVIRSALDRPKFQIDVLSEPVQLRGHLELHRPRKAKQGETRTEDIEPYHLVILDYVLPGLEPEQVFGWLADWQPDASIIVVTGHPSVESALTCLRARTYDYLTKPFQVTQLRDIVLRCLEGKGLLRMDDDALKLALGTAIRERRKALDLTLSTVAERADVSLGYLSQIELGKNSASIETLYKICLALGIRMADLFQVVQRGA